MIEQRSPEWFEARKGKITASSAGAILGLAPYMSRDDVMRSMVREHFGSEREFTGNVATEYGQFHEAGALYDLKMQFPEYTIRECGFYSDGIYGASPDAMGANGEEDFVIEIKCPYSMRDESNESRIFKPISEQMHYYAQMQMQMHVVGVKKGLFVQYAPNMPLYTERVERDEIFVSAMLVACLEFYVEFQSIINGDVSDYLEPKRRIIETVHARRLIDEYLDLKQVEDNAKSRMQDILSELTLISNGKDADVCGMKLTKVKRAGSVKYQQIVKEHLPDIDVSPYRGEGSEYWRLS